MEGVYQVQEKQVDNILQGQSVQALPSISPQFIPDMEGLVNEEKEKDEEKDDLESRE